jgi:Bacterial protein of unknown function (DUF839)
VWGVGSLTFDQDGNVLAYERLLTGKTVRNCGGGKTFWNTWLTCEEYALGQIWEVDPFRGGTPPRQTIMAAAYRSAFESAAYDNSNPALPTFYATVDRANGPLLKFTPPPAAVATARASKDYTQLLHTKVSRAEWATAYQYLVLNPSGLTFAWTSNKRLGEKSASRHYKNCEGIGRLLPLRM